MHGDTLLSDYITTAELASELKRSPETVIRWRRQRIGPPWLSIQSRVLYSRKAVEKWLADRSVEVAA